MINKILCPYCKQEIDETAKVCPFCTSKILKEDYKKFLFPLGTGLYILWLVANIIGLIAMNHYPQVLTMRDKDKDLILSLPNYVQLCLHPMIIILVPYIIAAVKKYQTGKAIVGIIITVLTSIIFISYFICLQKLAGV